MVMCISSPVEAVGVSKEASVDCEALLTLRLDFLSLEGLRSRSGDTLGEEDAVEDEDERLP